MATVSHKLRGQWGWMAARGVLAIIFGILAFVWPGMVLLTLVILYGIYALTDGVAALVFAAGGGRSEAGKTWPLVVIGLAGIAAGIITFVWPGITAMVLLYIIAFWSIVRGVFEVGAAFQLRRETSASALLGVAGAMSVIFGVLLLAWPVAGIMALVWLVALYAIIVGVVGLGLAFQMRREARGEAPKRPSAPPMGRPTAA